MDKYGDFCVPGLKQNMVPQGLTYYPERNWLLISAYHEPEEQSSAVFALDRATGKFVAQFNLYERDREDVKKSTAHVGGIAVSDNNLYVAIEGSKIAYIPLDEIDIPDGYQKDICYAGTWEITDLGEANTSYMSYADGYLWTGNFYSFSGKLPGFPDSWAIKAPGTNSLLLGYHLTGGNSTEEWVKLTQKATADYTIYIDNAVDQIQGAFVRMDKNGTGGTIILSRTSTTSFSGLLTIGRVDFAQAKLQLNGLKTLEYENDRGAQNIVVVEDRLYCVYESAAMKYNHKKNVECGKNNRNTVECFRSKNSRQYRQI